MARHLSLVSQHAERLSRRFLEEHGAIVRDHARGRNGIYALYRGERLYYVGLASDLRSRMKQHLRDTHAKSWDRFSLYLTNGDAHMREIEALVLRIAAPKGNKQRGRLAGSANLAAEFLAQVKAGQRDEIEELFGERRRPAGAAKRVSRGGRQKRRRGDSSDRRPLAGLVTAQIELRATYKRRELRAIVTKDGEVRLRGRVFDTPSAAAEFVVRRPCNGWSFWEYEAEPGTWVKLAGLRRGLS